jgi:putative spermidine/putrescine transport system ATP-binding protein
VTSRNETAGAVEFRGLRKLFGSVRAVDGVDIAIEPGEFVTLLGPSGSGKTTILRLVAGFERPTEGSILIDGRDVAALPPARRGVGVVFQQYALFPHMTVSQNIGYGLKVRRVNRRLRAKRIEEMLELVRLAGYGNRYPRQLSGGQQQRIAVARALAFAPALLLMDEPLGALDRALRTDLEQELRRIHHEIGTTMVYVTHDQEEALALSDRIAVLRDGLIVQIGSAEELYERPRDEFVARFFGECNILAIKRSGAQRDGLAEVLLNGTTFSAPSTTAEELVRLVVRPERLRLTETAGDISVEGVVSDLLYLGERTRLTVRYLDNGKLISRVDPGEARSLRPSEPVKLFFSPWDAVVVEAAS